MLVNQSDINAVLTHLNRLDNTAILQRLLIEILILL